VCTGRLGYALTQINDLRTRAANKEIGQTDARSCDAEGRQADQMTFEMAGPILCDPTPLALRRTKPHALRVDQGADPVSRQRRDSLDIGQRQMAKKAIKSQSVHRQIGVE